VIDLLSSGIAALDLGFLRQPPASTLFILGLSVVISLVTTLANRLVMDLEEFKRWTVESSHLRQELMEAIRNGNQRRIAKARKRQQDMMKTQQKMTMDRMKIMLFFMVPFLLIWRVLGGFFKGVIVAYMPFDAPWIGRELSISTWYLFCSFSTSIVISRVLGLTFEIEPKES